MTVGLMLSNRAGRWLKGEIPFGKDRMGDWSITASLSITRH